MAICEQNSRLERDGVEVELVAGAGLDMPSDVPDLRLVQGILLGVFLQGVLGLCLVGGLVLVFQGAGFRGIDVLLQRRAEKIAREGDILT